MKKVTLGLAIPCYPQMFSTFYTMEIIQGISGSILGSNVDILVHIAQKKAKDDLKIFDRSAVSGILFADHMGNEELIKKAKLKKIPHVILNYYDKKAKHNCIGIDNQSAAKKAVDYLVKQGHKNIAIVTGKLKAQAGKDRLAGYKAGLKKHKISASKKNIIQGDWTEDAGRKALAKILKTSPRPSAVFVSGDEMALGLIKAAKAKKVSIPDDLSVVGFDDIQQASTSNLTTVKQPLYEVGKLGVKSLLKVIKNGKKQPVKTLLKTSKIVQRNTTTGK